MKVTKIEQTIKDDVLVCVDATVIKATSVKQIYNTAIEDAASWHENRAVLCEKEVGKDTKGKQKYSEAALRHRWFAGNIRGLKK